MNEVKSDHVNVTICLLYYKIIYKLKKPNVHHYTLLDTIDIIH